jgi:gas vesicle protein
MMSAPKVITLLLLGIAGGILIAPAKGSKTRKKLSKLANDVSDSFQDIIDIVRGESGELSCKSVERVDNAIADHGSAT